MKAKDFLKKGDSMQEIGKRQLEETDHRLKCRCNNQVDEIWRKTERAVEEKDAMKAKDFLKKGDSMQDIGKR